MLTRLRVSGFKNLVEVDIRFGPFTCIAGANGVGKSNLFDAIRFLSALADMPLMDAAASVRDEAGRSRDISTLFHHTGERFAPEISFEAEMIVPLQGVDDLGQEAKASITFLRYRLRLAYRDQTNSNSKPLEIIEESLVQINKTDAKKNLPFPHNNDWRESVIDGKRSGGAFISTSADGIIQVHQDGGGRGKPRSFLAASLLRSLISASNAAESPTMLLARREMQSWRLLQLEPSALRRPDEYNAPSRLGMDGGHLPATLYRLVEDYSRAAPDEPQANSPIYTEIANRLANLIEDVRTVYVDRDESRRLSTLMASIRDGTTHSAKALSDGTLRFLALSVLELDPQETGLICLEEPENGIHPARIPAMLRLLQEIATDPDEAVDSMNPLRQVIINTHSPAVVQQVPEDSLIVAQLQEALQDGKRFKRANFAYLESTWREKASIAANESPNIVAKGRLLSYLNPAESQTVYEENNTPLYTAKNGQHTGRVQRVIDRPDLQPLLFMVADDDGTS